MKFTESITQLLAGHEVPDYARLRNDFRLVEVAKIMQFKNVPPGALRFLLYECPLKLSPLPARIHGIRRLESGEATCGTQMAESHSAQGDGLEYVERYRREFRGGVEANVFVNLADFAGESSGELEALSRKIRRSQPQGGAAVWRVPA